MRNTILLPIRINARMKSKDAFQQNNKGIID